MEKEIYFFIGTEAELIKLFPVIIECQSLEMICNIIATGQNDLKTSRILEFINLNGKFIELSKEENIKKSTLGLFEWFIKTSRKASGIIRNAFSTELLKGADIVIHGDTISTMLGAFVGRKLEMRVCHVEAGLRSHNFLNPFPEEIDRFITSKLARVHFAPGDLPMKNLKKAKGTVINTKQNTLLDSLRFSQDIPVKSNVKEILSENYFVFVMHRQENLANEAFVESAINQVMEIARKYKCVFILHKITESVLKQLGLLQELKKAENFILLPRVDYFDFMKLLNGAQFVITDGGSNQEELYYMGKPCMIIRKTTERSEGIGKNAVMFDGNINSISSFASEFQKYKIQIEEHKESPAKIISSYLSEIGKI